mmetsp:Transcript_10943/g.9429  ORF Transcript_10943/g.9429 Transcript_10943/m.9429 type:complete len:228 (-) Transcript_10943:186-869(-)|eukprot:CAMPEP_0114585624 /NCGR_PEP_ID=MMETSP0125-20121206/9103_1 /TAXON_ID=485358 ORGANISM="Aristerostoma sp., Strain ATCC 50986" /NCGR_SAMPLE_ID=MMETSP0125 /ASSEMBLY_ACC=CAM_ASM_000245 /LENGTH=227 /DNA_ID=CAMNT_0001780759 /DNA_START=55 /DNA_END=738 /DNA_ORIENTATION=-
MRVAIIFALVLIVSTNAFHFGKVKDFFHHVGDQIKDGAHHVGHEIHKDAEKIKEKVDHLGKHIESIAKKGAKIAEEVAKDIEKGAEDVVKEAEYLATHLDVALECAEAVLKNKDIFKNFETIIDEPTKFVEEWDPVCDEFYNICVACSASDPSKFQWIKNIELTGQDMAIAKCTADIISVATDIVGLISGTDLLNLAHIKGMINGIIDLGKSCPTAVKEIENFVKKN